MLPLQALNLSIKTRGPSPPTVTGAWMFSNLHRTKQSVGEKQQMPLLVSCSMTCIVSQKVSNKELCELLHIFSLSAFPVSAICHERISGARPGGRQI